MSSWLKAGLIGAGILLVLNLIGIIPILNCLTLPLGLVAYFAIGALAASYLPPRRESGQAAKQGALAGMVAGFGGGLTSLVIGIIQASMGGVFQAGQILSQLPPDVRHQLRDLNISPDLIAGAGGVGGIAVCGSVCCVGGIIFAALFGAIGAALYATAKPE